jgi:hypothetical protein
MKVLNAMESKMSFEKNIKKVCIIFKQLKRGFRNTNKTSHAQSD